MFRYAIIGGILFTFTISLIVWATRADLIEKDIKKPLVEWNAAREAELWQAAKEEAWKEWAANIQLPADCAKPRTEVRKLECKNIVQLEGERFKRTWANKVRSGWKPDRVF